MSKGPGRVHSAILAAVNEPEAAKSYAAVDDYEWPGATGAPLAGIFAALYNTEQPTRAQRHSVHRAIRVLETRGEIESAKRPACSQCHTVTATSPCPSCGHPHNWPHDWPHRHGLVWVVQRPRTAKENKQWELRIDKAKAALAILGGRL